MVPQAEAGYSFANSCAQNKRCGVSFQCAFLPLGKQGMLNSRFEEVMPREVKAMAFAIGILGIVWVLSEWIITNNTTNLILGAVVAVGCVFLVATSNDWRNGVYVFLGWLVFEDLIRKFVGNSTYMFFAKDIIIGVTYLAMLRALQRRKLLVFKPPFLLWLVVFFGFGLIQAANPNSPSVLYGLLGLKLYFYYVPLMFAGYALLRTENDLHKILIFNTAIGVVVAGLGIVQSVLGLSFLNPADLAPDLQTLGHDVRYSPITHLEVQRGTSVYVSEGRYAQSLILFFILGCGTAGYLLMRTKQGRKLVFPALAVTTLATIMAGVRGSFVAVIASIFALTAGMLWGAPWRLGRRLRMGRTIRLALVGLALAIGTMFLLAPDAINARLALYSETLLPGSTSSDLGYRAWDYPVKALTDVFSQPNWQLGNGIGTASLGTQYVSRALDEAPPKIGAESGYGAIILEFGIIGPVVWTLWTVALLISAWKVVRKLRHTTFFPIAFAIFWYMIYVLGLCSFYGIATYQDYLPNAYLWLSVGMLFRMPGLLAEQKQRENTSNAPARS